MRLLCLITAATALPFIGSVSGQHVPVTGVATGIDAATGAVPERMNINDLCSADGPERTLYFRALIEMQNADPNDPLSWFQIAGIHGRPFLAWNGENAVSGGTGGGYCLHTEPGFLPWHRAYLAVFEQTLVQHAIRLAEEYPEDVRAQYQVAAQTLRTPFWDWATDARIPPCAATPQIDVDFPQGRQSVPNPLYSFAFPQEARDGQFGQVPDEGLVQTETRRCDASEANARLTRNNFRAAVYDVFTRSDTFAKASAGTDNTVIAFEQPHNTVHVDAACGNHFYTVGSAAFEPLFMLHHTNADRLWAIWQEIYPNEKTLSHTYGTGGSFSIPWRSNLGPTTHLSPFYGENDSRWNSQTVADIGTFGYTYPGVNFWNKNQEQRQSDAIALVNRLYGPNSSPRARRRADKPRKETRYFAKIQLDVTKVPLPLSMSIFLDGDLAGTFAILDAPEGCIAKGEVSLSGPLEKKGIVGLDVAKELFDLVGFIETVLQVAFVKPDGEEIPLEAVEGAYSVELEEADVTPSQRKYELPKYGEARKWPVQVKALPALPILHYERA